MIDTEDFTYRFSVPVQIRMSDLDPFAHVNNGVQCNLFDYGRSCYFEHVFGSHIDWLTMSLVIVHIEMDFLHPIDNRDNIVCETHVDKIGSRSISMVQRLKDLNTNTTKTACRCVIAGYDREKRLSVAIANDYKAKLTKFEQL